MEGPYASSSLPPPCEFIVAAKGHFECIGFDEDWNAVSNQLT